jgi:Carboxypeptidase regulatory-like domain
VTANIRRIQLPAGLMTLCLALSSNAARAQNANPAPQENHGDEGGYEIAGTAVNAITGAPLAKVKVSLADTQSRTRVISTVTGETGHFEFAELPQGKFSLQGSRTGFLTSSYDQHEQYSTAIVTGPDFATGKLVLRLTPMAMILGHVSDESGEPVRSARVHLFTEDHSQGMSHVTSAGGASTDDRGYFDVGVLQPGIYFVSVAAAPWYAVHPGTAQGATASTQRVSQALDVAYPTTFYGGATESESAAPIELKGGEHREIDIRLTPVPALHLLLHVAEGSPGGFQVPLFQKQVFDSVEQVSVGQMREVSPGVLELTGIPAGRYDLSLHGASRETEQLSAVDLSHDGQDLTATPGEALGKLKITMKMAGEEPLPRQYVVGLRDSRQKIAVLQPGDPNGEVELIAVKPGKYAIVIGAQGKQYAVARTITTSGEVSANEVNVAPGANGELTAEVAAGEVGIEGVVEKNGKPVSGAMVALVPKDPETHIEFFRRDQSDFDGTFFLRGAIPGTYTVVAVEDAWGFDWLKAGVLAGYAEHGQTITVGEKMRGTVRLPQPLEAQPK